MVTPGFGVIGALWPPKSTQSGVVDGTPQVSLTAEREAPAPGASTTTAAPARKRNHFTARPRVDQRPLDRCRSHPVARLSSELVRLLGGFRCVGAGYAGRSCAAARRSVSDCG